MYQTRTFYFLLPTLSTSILFTCFWIDLVPTRVSDDRKCVFGRRLYACINTWKFKASIPEKLHYCQRSKKWFTWHVISIISENKPHYYINTNEMLGELSRENLIFTCENNMLSSHVKISPLLWLHNKSRLSHQKNYWSEMVWYFIGVYIINSKKFILVKQQLCSCTTLFCTFFSNPSSTTTWHFLFSRPRFTELVKETQKVSVFFF